MDWSMPSDLARQAMSTACPPGASTTRQVTGLMPNGKREGLALLLPSPRNLLFRVDLT